MITVTLWGNDLFDSFAPACKGDLLFEEHRIICPACRKAYPIRDGIPVMLISEAESWTPGP